MIREIWVVCETMNSALLPVSRELLGKARRLADDRLMGMAAVLFGEHGADAAIALGADTVHTIPFPEPAPCSERICALALARLAKDGPPLAILIGSTLFGRTVAAQAAAMLETGLTADCTDLAMEDGDLLVQYRPAYAGNIMAEIVGSGSLPQMATVRQGVMPEPQPVPGRFGRVIAAPPVAERNPFILVSRTDHGGTAELLDARAILAGGMGAGEKGFALMRRLAERRNCRIGATRAAVNAGLASYAEQIGQTGVTVRPQVYIACGISGTVQHLAGMSGSRCIIAVNSDCQAPIFDHADFGCVGDCVDFLERLLEQC